VEASKNIMLLRLWSQCYIREWTYIGTKRLMERGLENLAVRHEAIYNALAERNEEKALQAVTAHLEELIEAMEAKKK
jgi:DNA-binding FadR family transcriptional regulator